MIDLTPSSGFLLREVESFNDEIVDLTCHYSKSLLTQNLVSILTIHRHTIRGSAQEELQFYLQEAVGARRHVHKSLHELTEENDR